MDITTTQNKIPKSEPTVHPSKVTPTVHPSKDDKEATLAVHPSKVTPTVHPSRYLGVPDVVSGVDGYKFSKKQQNFIKGYATSISAGEPKTNSQIAKDAGYSKNTAKEMACENLTKPHIQKGIIAQLEKVGLTDNYLDTYAKRAMEISENKKKPHESYQFWRDVNKMKGRLREKVENINLNVDAGDLWLQEATSIDDKID